MKINFQIKDKIIDGLLYIQKKNWVITVLIFLIVFFLAITIWLDCVFNPRPSETTLSNIIKIEQEYKNKMESIKKNHQILNAQSQRFNNPEETFEDRKYFEPSELTNLPSNNYNSSAKSLNPQMVP